MDKKKVGIVCGIIAAIVLIVVIVLVATVFSDWSKVTANRKETAELENKYNAILDELGKQPGILGAIFTTATSSGYGFLNNDKSTPRLLLIILCHNG